MPGAAGGRQDGEAAQVEKLLRLNPSLAAVHFHRAGPASAVPMALVPRWDSCHEAPLVSATRRPCPQPGSPSVHQHAAPVGQHHHAGCAPGRTGTDGARMRQQLGLLAPGLTRCRGVAELPPGRERQARGHVCRLVERQAPGITRPVGQWLCSADVAEPVAGDGRCCRTLCLRTAQGGSGFSAGAWPAWRPNGAGQGASGR